MCEQRTAPIGPMPRSLDFSATGEFPAVVQVKMSDGYKYAVACTDDEAKEVMALLERQASGASICRCGHADDWHSHGGEGSCEHDADCACQAFTGA